jgi:SAM-dependent methyltransferase
MPHDLWSLNDLKSHLESHPQIKWDSEKGFWVSKELPSETDYPDDGSELCFQIEEGSFWFKHRNQVIQHFMQELPPRGILIDVGGGNGFVAMNLMDSGRQVVNVEPSLGGCLNSRRRGIQLVIQSQLRQASLPDGVVGEVGLFDVLEHISGDLSLLREIHQILAPDGHLILTVPAFSFLWCQEDVDACHHRRYTAKSLGDLLRKCGFQVVRQSYFFSLLFLPYFFLRSLPYKLGLTQARDRKTAGEEHLVGESFLRRLLSWILKFEIKILSRGFSLPLGTSLIILARKSN